MAIYKYKIADAANAIHSGLIEAPNEDTAVSILKEHDYTVLSLNVERSIKGRLGEINLFTRVSMKDLMSFTRQFSVLVSANIVMVQALKVLIDQTVNMKLKIIISEIADEVDNGGRLSEAMAKREKVFSKFYVSVVRSGEDSGKLEDVLNYLADEIEKDYDLMGKIKGAVIYPAFVFSGLVVVGGIMMVFVVPKLTEIITSSGGVLPLPTRILIAVSGFLSSFWWVVIGAVVLAVIGFHMYYKTETGRRQVDYLYLKAPIFGKLFQMIYLVRFCRSMHTLIAGGVNMVSGLKVAKDVVVNKVYQDIIDKTIVEVEEGNSISEVFSEYDVIPKMVSQMIGIGEKTGKMDVVLARISEFYTREINHTVANLMTLLEPIIVVIMGVAAGGMVAAIILPMYNMAGAM